MVSKERAVAGRDEFIVKLNKLITKFELSLGIESALEIIDNSNFRLSESEIYFILEALKIFKEDLVNAVAY